MFNPTVTDTLTKIAARYSYVAKAKKYRNIVTDRNYTLDEAVEDALNVFATDHSQVYVSVAGKKEELRACIRDLIKSTTKKRKEKQLDLVINATNRGAMSSSLNGQFSSNPAWKPSSAFNVIDAEWCEGIFYCKISNTLYGTLPSGALEVLGAVGDSRTIINLATRFTAKPHEFIKRQFDELSKLYVVLQSYEQDGEERMLAVKVNDGQTIKEYLGIKDDDIIPQTADEITAKIIHYMLNNTLPASVFSGLAKVTVYREVFVDESGTEHKTIKGYYYDMGKQGFLTAKAYFENIIENYIEYIPQIELPTAIRYDDDEDSHAFGIWRQDLYDEDQKKYSGLTLDESQIIRTYLSPMTSEQKNFVVAWWYAVVHAHERKMMPSLLQMDKGGTLKNTVANIIKMTMEKYYGCKCHYDLKQEQLTNSQYTYNSSTQKTLGDAVWCHYDEVATKGKVWDDFKGITGGPTVDVPIKRLYSNPYTQPSSVVFFFASNKPVYITDMGAFKRRLAIISTKGDNTYKDIPVEFRRTMNSDKEVMFREFFLLMKLGKAAYEILLHKYGGLTEAANTLKDIAGELDSSSPWDEYYEGFYASLFEEAFVERTISNDDLARLFLAYKSAHPTSLALDEAGMRRYCANANTDNKKSYIWCTTQKRSVRGWKLFAPIYKKTSDMEEYVPIGEPLRPGMNLETGNVKKTDPMEDAVLF